MSVLVIVIIILLLVTIFSVQNSAPVAISFLLWKFEASLAIVVFLSVLLGAIVGAIAVFSIRSKKSRRISAGGKTEESKERANV
jgi:lipopolysaccharide assembly protein A